VHSHDRGSSRLRQAALLLQQQRWTTAHHSMAATVLDEAMMRMFGETFVNEENKQFFEAFSWAIPHVCETEFVIDLDQT
jgi:hypothetical protein